MFEEIDREIFLDLYNYFESLKEGNQIRKLDEEHGELQRAMYAFDNGFGDIQDVIDEFADDFILLLQHMYAREIEPSEIYGAMLKKLERTQNRKKDKYYERHN